MDAPWEDFQSSNPTPNPSTSVAQSSNDAAPWEDFQEKPGMAMSAFKGAANNIPLMPQAIAAGTSLATGGERPYSQNLEDWNKQAAQAKAANPISYGAGAVAGAVAPLAIPGVGEAMAANPIASNALYGGLNAISNKDLTKDVSGTLKEGALGAGIGGAIGGAGQLLGKGMQALKPAAKEVEHNVTAAALDLGPFGLRKLARAEGPKANPEEIVKNIGKEIKELMPDLVGVNDTPSMKFEKLSLADKQAGETIGNVIDQTTAKMGKNPLMPEVDDAIKQLKTSAKGYEGFGSERNLAAKAELEDAALALENMKKSNQLNFKTLADLKTDVGQAYHNPMNQNPGLDETYHTLSKTIDNVLNRAMPETGLSDQYALAKRMYHLTSRLLPAMQRGVTREVAGTGGGLTNAAIGAGAIFGHPLTAGAAWLAKTGMKYLAPDIVPNLMYKGINAAKNVQLPAAAQRLISNAPQGARQELIDFLTSQYGNKGQQ